MRGVLRRATVFAVVVVAACSSAAGSKSTTPTSVSSPPVRATTSTTVQPTHSTGCHAPGAVARGISDHTITVDGVQRKYELEVPANYDGTKPYALVFGLHALTVDYRFIPGMVGFDMGARYHFIGVSPSGLLDGTTPYWNAAPVTNNGDVRFIGQLLDELERTLCLDPSHVFSTGMSNGAQMSSLLACRLADRIAGIAPVSGEEFLAPCNGRPVPIIAFHGTVDPILPYRGGGLNATRIATTYLYKGHPPRGLPAPLGIDASMRRWAAHNRCAPAPVERRVAPQVRLRTWQHCAAATELYIVEGAGHSWPGKPIPQFEKQFGPGTTEIDASTLMFQFFFGASSGR